MSGHKATVWRQGGVGITVVLSSINHWPDLPVLVEKAVLAPAAIQLFPLFIYSDAIGAFEYGYVLPSGTHSPLSLVCIGTQLWVGPDAQESCACY